MNYLAHAYLSFDQPGILTGNMISDFVKGKKKFDYPPEIQAGIQLHRQIDQFTDDHPATKAIKDFFRPVYGLYSGAFTDVAYDHFLANDEHELPGALLSDFSQKTYSMLENHTAYFPEKFARMFPYMKQYDWLFNYRFREGLQQSFEGLVRRAAYINNSTPAGEILDKNYQAIKEYYQEFFPSVKKFACNELKKMNPGNQGHYPL